MENVVDDNQFKIHWSNKHCKLTFQCSKCPKIFATKESVEKHSAKNHYFNPAKRIKSKI